MVFFVIIPALRGGFGNYFIPLLAGAHDMAFPRLNNVSFWLLVPAFILFMGSAFVDGEPGTGWTPYRPLSNLSGHQEAAVDMTIFSVHLTGLSSILGSINLIVTIFNMGAPGMGLFRMPLFVCAILVTALLMVLAMPVLAVAITMLLTDRNFRTTFFKQDCGSDPVLFQHLFWFFGHPEVYIVILPGFGIVSQGISTVSHKPLFGYQSIAGAMVIISFVGFIVCAHHMSTVRLSYNVLVYFTAGTMIIAVPTGIKIFSCMATTCGCSITFLTPMLFSIGFIILFTIGGITGIILSNSALDRVLHDTYYIVTHFHYAMSLSALFEAFAGFYYWFDKISGKQYPEILDKIHFWITFIGVNLTFFPQHFLGLAGMPRRIPNYPEAFADWNMVSSIGAGISMFAALYFIFIVFYTLKYGKDLAKIIQQILGVTVLIRLSGHLPHNRRSILLKHYLRLNSKRIICHSYGDVVA